MTDHLAVFMALALTPALALSAAGQDVPALRFPADCTLGETCFLQQFMDRDPGPGAQDFLCGPQSYDGHTGTDIRVADEAAMAAGVTVIAAAPGIVRATRDSLPDLGTAATPDGQGCGNGVVIDHADGWQTQYCHLRLGSVTVQAGQSVEAGTPLGLVGRSGFADFPHVEFLLRRDGQFVDPFAPSDLSVCGAGAEPLWTAPVPVSGGGLLSVGFAAGIPEFAAIRAGTAGADTLASDAPALVLWGFVHGGRDGDQVRLTIRDGSDRVVHDQTIDLDRTQAELFRASGRRTPAGGWARGVYTGSVLMLRDGQVHDLATTTVTLR